MNIIYFSPFSIYKDYIEPKLQFEVKLVIKEIIK